MAGRHRARASIIISSVCMLLSLPVSGQQTMQAFFGPPAFKPHLTGELQWYGFETSDIEDSEQELALRAYGFQADYRQAVSREYEWLLSGRAARYDVDTAALIPGTDSAIPETLWDLRLGAGVKRRFESQRSLGLVASAGSPSDRPFHSFNETQIGATAFYLIPAEGRNMWAFFLNYSNRRSFLNNVPLPGAAYLWVPSRSTFAMIGLPVALLRASPLPDWTLELFYFPPIRGRARVAYAWTPQLESYVRVRSDRDAFLRWDRDERDAWLRHAVVQGDLGVGWKMTQHISVDASIGYAFDRKVYESDSFGDSDDALELEPGLLAALKLVGTL